MSSPAFCTAMPTLWMSEFCLASILSSAAFWARMVLPMSLATLRRLAMIALTCGYTEAAAEVSTEFHKIQISPVSARRSAANYAVTIDGVRNI